MKIFKCTLVLSLVVLILVSFIAINGRAEDQPESSHPVQTDSAGALSPAINGFGFKLAKNLFTSDSESNVFISPVSVHLAFGMTFMGASSETETEMAEVLGMEGLNKKKFAELTARLLEDFEETPDVEVSVANSIWARVGLPFEKNFLKTGKEFFNAEIAELNFSSAEALETINRWVKDNTNGKIDKIVEQLNPLDVMVLLNAIYFEGPWRYQFKEEKTDERTFYLEDGSEKLLPMMSQSGKFQFLERKKVKLIRLPYGENERVAAYVALPKDDSGLTGLIKDLNRKSWRKWISSMESAQGKLVLPKFELQYETELNDPLQDLGMERAFDKVKADLTGIIDLPTQNAYISKSRHKTYLEVTEQGTKAAAATSVKIGLTSVGPSQDSFEMVVDRPFLFAIRHEETGALLFLGGVRNPQKVSKN